MVCPACGKKTERRKASRSSGLYLAVVDPMAVRPFVVAGRENERALECLVQRESVTDEIVVAPLAARLDVARVHHKVDVVVPIDLGDQPVERRLPDAP